MWLAFVVNKRMDDFTLIEITTRETRVYRYLSG